MGCSSMVFCLYTLGCRLHPLYRDATLQPHPPQTMCNYTNRSQNCFNQLNKKDNETEQEKDGLCAVSDTTLTVGVTDVTMNGKPAPSEVYLLVDGYGNGEDDPEAFATFTPDRAVEIAESLLRFARQAKQRKSKVD